MNSPYMGRFYVSQGFRPKTNPQHDALDLVGQDSKKIHSTVNGTVRYAGWENPSNHNQGFGMYVCVHGDDGLYYYFGHLSQLKVSTGDSVHITDVIGIEGSTGRSTGSHCHYEIRKGFYKGAEVINICTKSGIPNDTGKTFDDGYRISEPKTNDIFTLQRILNSKGSCLDVDGIAGAKTLSECYKYTIESGDQGQLTRWVQQRLNALGFSCGQADGISGTMTMNAIHEFQKANNHSVGVLKNTDWDVLVK